ncbi:hypothetical protein H3C61_01555 [Candidatus Gracilibacteria bacterium]|nr:hypothetical protein [Candidatus Gracilibacteria bacterium]
MVKNKIITGFLVGSIFLSPLVSGATYDNKDNGYKAPITKNEFNFTLKVDGDDVILNWTRFDNFLKKDFKYYKVVRSSSNPNPVYPDDGYIKYEDNIGVTSYTDEDAEDGINYYRVCAITEQNERYCSKTLVAKIVDIGDNKEEKYEEKEVEKKYNEEKKVENKGLSKVVTKKLNVIISNFEKKLNEKLGDETAKKVEILNNAIVQLEKLKEKNKKVTNIVDYVIKGINNILSESDFSEIEKILEVK